MADGESGTAPVWQSAIALLEEIARVTEIGAVVRASIRSGLLARLRVPISIDDLARSLSVDETRVAAVLDALRTVGIVDGDGDCWSLTEPWAAAMAGDSPMDLTAYVEAPLIRMRQFERAFSGSDDYWQLSPEDRLAVARGVSFNPASPAMTGILRRDLDLLDGVVAALQAGGRVLELGCGVGSRLTAMALAFPQTHAVGVELDAELVAFGRGRAAELGVQDRVTYVVADATTYDACSEYDLVTWSQFFFPARTRAAALATAYRALRPGAWVTAPVIWTEEQTRDMSKEDQELALEALNLDIWNVPARTTTEVTAELEAAGFIDVRVDDMAFVNLVRGRRPVAT